MQCHTGDELVMWAQVEKVAKALGRPVELDGEVRYAFPSPQRVVETGVETLERLRLGMDRHSKIFAAAQRICAGRLDLSRLSQPEACYAEAKRRLMACRGIGNKIADCIALFALDKDHFGKYAGYANQLLFREQRDQSYQR